MAARFGGGSTVQRSEVSKVIITSSNQKFSFIEETPVYKIDLVIIKLLFHLCCNMVLQEA